MNTKGTAIDGQCTPSVKMLYISCSKRGQSTCFAVEGKKLLDDSLFHHHSVGSDSYLKASETRKPEQCNFSL